MSEYVVRICRTCGTVDEDSLPASGGSPRAEPTLYGEPGRSRLPEWTCRECGGGEFRIGSWDDDGSGVA